MIRRRNHPFTISRFLKIGVVLLLTTFPENSVCADGKGPNNSDDKESLGFGRIFQNIANKGDSFQNILAKELSDGSLTPVKKIFDDGVPMQAGYGFLMGYSSGYCLKKVSKVVAFLVGSAFILLQTLSYTGHIVVDYGKLQSDAEKVLDMNDDGKVDVEDAKISFEKIKKILGNQMPTGGGFAAGLFMGLRK